MKEYKDARIEAMQKQLAWCNNFIDYVEQYSINVYNSACEYADIIEEEE